MTAIEVACPTCTQQPGEPCIWPIDGPVPWKSGQFHDSRCAQAARITSMESGAATQDAPTLNDFNQAVDDSGLV